MITHQSGSSDISSVGGICAGGWLRVAVWRGWMLHCATPAAELLAASSLRLPAAHWPIAVSLEMVVPQVGSLFQYSGAGSASDQTCALFWKRKQSVGTGCRELLAEADDVLIHRLLSCCCNHTAELNNGAGKGCRRSRCIPVCVMSAEFPS
jgi:hypothetical protein